MELTSALNVRELQRYLSRIGDRWPLEVVMVGGARVADLRRQPEADRTRGPEYVMVLVSEGFDGMPWLERTHQAGALWDGLEMGGPAQLHCFTANEFIRRRETLPAVREVVERGLLLFEDSAPLRDPGARDIDP